MAQRRINFIPALPGSESCAPRLGYGMIAYSFRISYIYVSKMQIDVTLRREWLLMSCCENARLRCRLRKTKKKHYNNLWKNKNCCVCVCLLYNSRHMYNFEVPPRPV